MNEIAPVPVDRSTADIESAAELSSADAAFQSAVGKRVRELRERRGMARKLLAREAHVSERYLGLLELGDGNVSMNVLRRVATALNVTLIEILLPEQEDTVEKRLIRRFLERIPAHRLEEVVFRLMREFGHEEASRRKRIALIGLRGAGKSTLGSLLAKELRIPFVEIKREIERETGLPTNEVFALYGQAGYRRIERRCLERTIKDHERVVLSVGGGIVAEEEVFKLLLGNCYTVWLKATPEEHMARVLAQGDLRPMAGNEEALDEMKRILAAREPLYGKADAIVDTSGRTAEATFAKLREIVLV